MKRLPIFGLLAAMLAGGACLAQTNRASNYPEAAVEQPAAPQAAASGAPAAQVAGRGAGRGGFGGPIELGPDDKPAFPDPPAGFNQRREAIPHGELTALEYDSQSLGTRRRMRVYTPPGYSDDKQVSRALPAARHRRRRKRVAARPPPRISSSTTSLPTRKPCR